MLLIAAAGLIAGVLWGAVWWEERPLAEVEKQLRNKDYDQALALVDRFLRKFPENGRGIALKARALVHQGNAAEAVRLFDQVGAASPDEIRDCAKAFLILQRWLQALPLLEYLHTMNPKDPDLLHELSACRAKLGRYDDAITAALEFSKLPECEARGYTLIGLLETERGNHRTACEAWQRVLTISPGGEGLQVPPEEFLAEYGAALLKVGNPTAALVQLQRSVSTKPTVRSLMLLGKAFYQEGRIEEAKQTWQEVISLDKTNEESRQGLAELAMKRSDFSSALNWLMPLAEAPTISSTTAFLLQRAFSLSGDQTTSQQWQSRANEIRRREERNRTVDQILIDSPTSLWGQVLQAYRLAEQENWDQAALMMTGIPDEQSHPFITKLANAVRDHGPLPDLTSLPLEVFP
ncbi:MAG: tetratricopeptide repeat protein [Planctomycetales bacterium]|nr:tetratricopeptide repeat protein [Planctomycetales bacterium]